MHPSSSLCFDTMDRCRVAFRPVSGSVGVLLRNEHEHLLYDFLTLLPTGDVHRGRCRQACQAVHCQSASHHENAGMHTWGGQHRLLILLCYNLGFSFNRTPSVEASYWIPSVQPSHSLNTSCPRSPGARRVP
jgi:hypothetical protein